MSAEKDSEEFRTETLMVLCGSAAHCEFAVNVVRDGDLSKPNDERCETLTSICNRCIGIEMKINSYQQRQRRTTLVYL